MLQNWLTKISLSVTILIWFSQAQAILFQAPSAGSEEFQRYALERNQQTYTQWALKAAVDNESEAHPQVLDFAQQALQAKPSKQLIQDWTRLRQSIELNRADREVLTLLAEKLKQPQELCRYLTIEPDLAALLENPETPHQCEKLLQSLPKNFSQQIQAEEILLIDGKAVTKNQLPVKLVAGSYQWKIISNRYEDRKFVGTPAEFASQKFFQQSWVSGNCKEYKIQNKDAAFLMQSQIYFNSGCVVSGIQPEKTLSSWASEHKTLLWGVGILAAGIMAAQLKDKTLVITKP